MQVRYGLLLRLTRAQPFDAFAEFEFVLCRPEVMDAAWGAILLGEGLIAVPPAPTFSFTGCFVGLVPPARPGKSAPATRRRADFCHMLLSLARMYQNRYDTLQ